MITYAFFKEKEFIYIFKNYLKLQFLTIYVLRVCYTIHIWIYPNLGSFVYQFFGGAFITYQSFWV